MKMKKIIKDQNGASAVEFAIILPLLILVIFGIIEFSLLLFNKQVITNATREGARYGVIVRIPRVSNPEIKDRIEEYAKNHLVTFGADTDALKIYIASTDDGDAATTCKPDNWVDRDLTTTNDERCLQFGSELKVVVTYEYEFLVLKFAKIDLKATSIMRME